MQLVCEGHPQVSGFSNGVQAVLYRPTVLDEPVLQGGSDADASGASIYGSVIRDGGTFRMWYQAWPRDWDGQDVVAVACAESDDGLTWRRPCYGLLECCGSADNHLTDLPFHCPSVWIDPTAGGSARYRAFGYADPRKVARYERRISQSGYFTAHSADGLHWELDSPDPIWPWGDVITSAWDLYAGCARIALKHNLRKQRMTRRSFFTAEWSQGRFTEPVSALIPEEYDDMLAQARGFNSADYYGVGLMPTAGPTIGFLWNFRHQLPLGYSERGMFHHGRMGRVDLSIVYQTERGGRWQHATGRPDWLCAEDAPPWARGALYTASSPLDVGDETWLYLTGSLDRHGWCGHGVDYGEWRKSVLPQHGWARIGLARWPRNRIIGYRSLLRDLVVLSPSAQRARDGDDPAARGQLVLNVAAATGGMVRAQIVDARTHQPIPGYDLEACRPITGDQLAATVQWDGEEQTPRAGDGQSLLAEIELAKATLYAFDFTIPA